MWQDYVIFFGAFVLDVGMIPALFSKLKPPITSCLITTIVLTLFCIAFYTEKLYWSSFAEVLGAGIWSVLIVQSMRKL